MSSVDYEALFDTIVERADGGDAFSIGVPTSDGGPPSETVIGVRAIHVDEDAGVAVLRETDLPDGATDAAEQYGLDRVLLAELTDGTDDEPPVLEAYHEGTFIGNVTSVRAAPGAWA